MKTPRTFVEAEMALRKAGVAYPEVTEDFPWGHRTVKVRGQAFVFMSQEADGFSLSVKLPESHPVALTMPFAQPTGYGLGKSGWVSASFSSPSQVPLPLLLSWLELQSSRTKAAQRLAGLNATFGAPCSVLHSKAAGLTEDPAWKVTPPRLQPHIEEHRATPNMPLQPTVTRAPMAVSTRPAPSRQRLNAGR